MARITIHKKWKLPLGWWIVLSHGEACTWTSSTASAVRTAIISKFPAPWGPLVAAVIGAQSNKIRELNEKSGGKGVKLLFLWATGMISSIERRGKGTSPCS